MLLAETHELGEDRMMIGRREAQHGLHHCLKELMVPDVQVQKLQNNAGANIHHSRHLVLKGDHSCSCDDCCCYSCVTVLNLEIV